MNQLAKNDFDTASSLEPSFELFQTPFEVIVIAHLPGIVKEEVRIEGSEKDVTIRIVGPADPQQISRMGYYSHEVVKLYGFFRTLAFPATVDFSKAKATFKNSILEVRVPKKN